MILDPAFPSEFEAVQGSDAWETTHISIAKALRTVWSGRSVRRALSRCRAFRLAGERGLVDREVFPNMNPLRIRTRLGWLSLVLSLVWSGAAVAEPQASTVRPPQGAVDQAEWLENMIRFHRFTAAEVRAATGLGDEVIAAAVKQWGAPSEASSVGPGSTGFTNADGTIRLLPYPGGRHPRLGF